MTAIAVSFDAGSGTFNAGCISLADIQPLLDGQPIAGPAEVVMCGDECTLTWFCNTNGSRPHMSGRVIMRIHPLPLDAGLQLEIALQCAERAAAPQSLGVRVGRISGAKQYLRNGYTSWDGSYFVDPKFPLQQARQDASRGFAVTALLSDSNCAVLGFLRHDRFQSRLQFTTDEDHWSLDIETLLDGSRHEGEITAEAAVLLAGTETEATLRRWAHLVAGSSIVPPRLRQQRITGWCSWYSLYNSISEPVLLEHLRAAAEFRDSFKVPFEVFQIDDGFTPEMGDWLELKPQFPRGMAPLLSDIAASGFVPGLWIAPFMVGNRSRLYAEHPQWMVADRATGKPLTPMKFYGEFRWHKRSEEYYVLDITVPEAEAYMRNVFRVWTREWGCRYFKTDFMYFGSEYGPEQARWHEPGLSRMQVWMRMARLIREEIGDSLWLGCGGPIWAPIGLMDAVRIGRDIGVNWRGNQSAESLLRDECSRNFANGVFWQSDPDCVLLRSRFHELTDLEVRSLALFAGLSGGLLMTSDRLDEVSDDRRQLLAELIGDGKVRTCFFPQLGQQHSVLVQQVLQDDGSLLVNMFNTTDNEAVQEVPGNLAGGMRMSIAAHESRLLTFNPCEEQISKRSSSASPPFGSPRNA